MTMNLNLSSVIDNNCTFLPEPTLLCIRILINGLTIVSAPSPLRPSVPEKIARNRKGSGEGFEKLRSK
jgi:hypothetical protein